jgi:hypothetical protein
MLLSLLGILCLILQKQVENFVENFGQRPDEFISRLFVFSLPEVKLKAALKICANKLNI